MRIVITGATGFIGRQIVPRLLAAGADLLLVGRKPESLRGAWPGVASCTFENVATRAVGYDLLVHLEGITFGAHVTSAELEQANISLLLEVAHAARKAAIPCFLNVSSVHALDARSTSDYPRAKRLGAERLRNEVGGMAIATVYLPIVYGDSWSGRVAFLNHLPQPVARGLFHMFAAFQPTVHVDELVSRILDFHEIASDDVIILAEDQDRNFVFRSIKRLVDVTFAVTVLGVFWWLLLVLWLVVRLDSPGPGFFVQERVGKDGRRFRCFKFRTMREGTLQAGTHEVHPAAVTRVGKFLRRTKLDELPQIWNILRNELSLIGPRPCLPVQTRLIEARTAHGVLKLTPGISGLAQINGIDMSEPDELATWDARYMVLRSLLLDLSIAISTGMGKGFGDPLKGSR